MLCKTFCYTIIIIIEKCEIKLLPEVVQIVAIGRYWRTTQTRHRLREMFEKYRALYKTQPQRWIFVSPAEMTWVSYTRFFMAPHKKNAEERNQMIWEAKRQGHLVQFTFFEMSNPNSHVHIFNNVMPLRPVEITSDADWIFLQYLNFRAEE